MVSDYHTFNVQAAMTTKDGSAVDNACDGTKPTNSGVAISRKNTSLSSTWAYKNAGSDDPGEWLGVNK